MKIMIELSESELRRLSEMTDVKSYAIKILLNNL